MGRYYDGRRRFLSTPSARRATFQPVEKQIRASYISIHALCEEGDLYTRSPSNVATIFLSTPSARRATMRVPPDFVALAISIHALCEEGDARRLRRKEAITYFYPRPLRGGRLFGF